MTPETLSPTGPLHVQVRSRLQKQIVAMRAGDRLPSERELSDQFKVDRVTIRRALLDLAAQGVVVRRQGKGTFVSTANLLDVNSGTAQKLLALILPDVNVAKHARLVEGIEQEAKQRSYEVIVCNSFNDRKREAETIQQLAKLDLSAILVHPFSSDSYDPDYAGLLNRIQACGKRLVMVGQYHPAAKASSVMTDKVGLGFIAAEHLIRLKHERICYMCTAGYEAIGDDCLTGYHRALQSYGISKNESLELAVNPNSMEEESRELFVKLWKQRPNSFTAIATPQIGITKGIIQASKELGLNIPRDIALVGSDVGYFPEYSYITHTRQKIGEIGRKAIQLLFMDEDDSTKMQILIQPELVIRSTCGAK